MNVEKAKAVNVEDDIDKDALYEDSRSTKNLGSNKEPSFFIQYYVFVEDVSKGKNKP